MVKKSLIIGVLFLTGCMDPIPNPIPVDRWKEEDISLRDVKGLEDCQFFRLRTHTHSHTLKVIRCPNSSTSTNYNQSSIKSSIPISNTVVDGDNADDNNRAKELILLKKIDELNQIIKRQQQSLNDASKILNERK